MPTSRRRVPLTIVCAAALTVVCFVLLAQTPKAAVAARPQAVSPPPAQPAQTSAQPAQTISQPAQTQPPTETSGGPITISAVGDVMLGSTFPDASRLPPNDGRELLQAFTPALKQSDIVFGNLEGPILDGGTSTKCPVPVPGAKVNCYAFRVPTRFAPDLAAAGFTVMSLANNHAGDFGDEGRASTRHVLDGLGIAYVGSDRDRFATTTLTIRGTRIGVIGFAHNDVVPNVNDIATARTMVARLKRSHDLVIVSFHGGAEGVTHQHVLPQTEVFYGEPRGNLPAFAHAVIDAGADLVLGHGPHVMRGMEIYKGRLIAYSMGNFCTYGWFNLDGETSLTSVFHLELAPDGRFLRGRLYPGRQIEPGGPVPDPAMAALPVIRQLSLADFGVNAVRIAADGTFSAPAADAP